MTSDEIGLSIFYTEVIVVTGTPRFALQDGSQTRSMSCTRHATVDTALICRYTVVAEDVDFLTRMLSLLCGERELSLCPNYRIPDHSGTR